MTTVTSGADQSLLAQVNAQFGRLGPADRTRFGQLTLPVVLEALADAPCIGGRGAYTEAELDTALAKWRPPYLTACRAALAQLTNTKETDDVKEA